MMLRQVSVRDRVPARETTMKICVVGAGSIGGLLGVKLALAGAFLYGDQPA